MNKIVYHGSPNSNINILKAHKSTHQKDCIYGTERKEVALLFSSKGHGDLDVRISSINGELTVVERRPGVLKKLYDKEGYIYELDGTTFNHYDYLWSQEVISFEKSIKPINKIYYPNILKAILEEERKGNIVIYRYPNRPQDMPVDNSDLINKYLAFEEQGLKGALSDLLEIYPEFADRVEKILKTKGK